MANKYYDGNNGSDSNDGSTPALAKLTRNAAVSASSAGDKVIAVNGIQIADTGHYNFNDDLMADQKQTMWHEQVQIFHRLIIRL
jgi:hypothetical protein